MNEKIAEDLIRDYLKGRMSPDDRAGFEKRLVEDPALAEEVALLRVEMAAAEQLIAEDARRLFRAWEKDKSSKSRFPGRGPLTWILVAVTAALLSLASWWYFRSPVEIPEAPEQLPPAFRESPKTIVPPVAETADPIRTQPAVPKAKNYRVLAARFYEDPVLSNLRRSAADSTRSLMQKARDAYASGDYQQTLELLEQTDSTQGQSAGFLAGHALFQLGRFNEAATAFDQLVDANSRQYRYQAEWGSLLCRVAELPKNKQVVEQQLNAILADPEHPYYGRAIQIQEEL